MSGSGMASSTAKVAFVDRTNIPTVKTVPKIHDCKHRTYTYEGSENDLKSVVIRPISFRGDGRSFTVEMLKSMWKDSIGFTSSTNIILQEPDSPDSLIPGKEKPKPMKACITKDEKLRKANIRHSKFEKKKEAAELINREKEQEIMELKIKSGLHFCNVHLCRLAFGSKVRMDKHIMSGLHFYGGCSKFTRRKRYAANSSKTPQLPIVDQVIQWSGEQASHFAQNSTRCEDIPEFLTDNALLEPTDMSGEYTFGPGILFTYAVPHPPLQAALKQSRDTWTRTCAQYLFIYEIFLVGFNDKENKYSPEQAEKLMHLKGTQEGFDECAIPYMEPNEGNIREFCLCDVLDSGQIKSYFGKSLAALKKLVANSMRKEGIQDPEVDHVNLDDEFVGIDAYDENEDGVVADEPEELYCVCNGVHGNRDMIECESCSKWFHCDCINYQLNENDNSYICDVCRSNCD